MRRHQIALTMLLLASLTLVSVPEAHAQQSGEADAPATVKERYKALTQQAAQAYRQKDYARALELFQEAYATKEVPNLLYNMGRIQEKRGEFDAAIEYYEKFVTEPGVDIKARRDALGRLKTLREVVALRKEGEDVDEKEVHEQHEDRELVEPAHQQREEASKQSTVEPNYLPAYLTLGGAVAAFATSGFFALQARDASSDFEAANTRELRREAASRGQTASIVADSALGAGVVLTAVSTYLFLSPPTEEAPADHTAAGIVPQLGRDGAGASFVLEF